jgi:hypothetical protein
MRNRSSAGLRLALVLPLALAISGCRGPADTPAITALVGRLAGVLATTDAASRTEGLEQIFDGLDRSEAESLTGTLAPGRREASLTVPAVDFLPLGDARVSISVLGEGTTSTMEVRAKKAGGAWKHDPSYHVKHRIDEVKAPER